MDGSQSSEKPTTTNDSLSMFSDERPLHERLREHLETCSECETVTQRPTGFGQASRLCSEYQDIIAVWSEQEGRANNIVDHDEFGNKASTAIHDWYPDVWR